MTHITPTPVSAFHTPTFDADDAVIVETRMLARAAYQSGPLVGDWVRLDDGELRQLAYTGPAGDKTKFTAPGCEFYLESNGAMSCRGDWRRGVPLDILRATDATHPGVAYIFHHNRWRSGNEVGFAVDLRVWQCPWLRTAVA